MKQILIVVALVVGFGMFALTSTGEASAMNKAELVDAIAGDSGLSKADSKRALEALTASMAATLRNGNSVQLVGFGKFSISRRAARVLGRQGDLPNSARACLWLAARTPAWLHDVFCTTDTDELAEMMSSPGDATAPPLRVKEALLFLRSFAAVTTGQLVKRDVVDIDGFGVFFVKDRRPPRLNIVKFDVDRSFVARIGRNPQTGKEIQIAAKNKSVVKFKAGADLSKKVN